VFGEEIYNEIEFVKADICDKRAMANAIRGVQYVIHVANPIPGAKSLSEEEQIRPAKEGMQNIINAAIKSRVKRIVVTSSAVTMWGGLWKKNTNNTYSELDYAPVDSTQDPYAKSKIY